ncbi:hypothetical protein [Paenibacillus montanisoli]|uniref:Uncharacterized protein n=1 Tax=Paenibacillus montanisoli TaxID=2081970 RepID=A0A328UA79_9BACL|nr:hypothetical protein [Paenibacillus montanisoli]RAP77134.1 hypothetical protein DL346_01115 [Paenibacillus montanisoli]
MGKAVTIDPKKDLEPILYEASKMMEQYKVDKNEILPPLFFSEDQSAELTDLKKTIEDYVAEMIGRFTTGTIKLNDEEWDKYLQTLDGMGLTRFIDIQQEAYDAKYGTK